MKVTRQLGEYENFLMLHPVSVSSTCHTLRLAVTYRPPNLSENDFLTDFASFLEEHALDSTLIITGDFNIHIDDEKSRFGKRFSDLLFAFGLIQNVKVATHIGGHVLDLVISRERDQVLICDPVVGDCVSDHNIVTCSISFAKPIIAKHEVSYRNIASVDTDKFMWDLAKTDIVRLHGTMNLEELTEQYDIELKSVLDKHAPIIKRTVRTIQREPWYNEGILGARRDARAHERRWRKYGNETDRQLFYSSRDK